MRTVPVTLLLAAAASAQLPFVSPNQAATVEGASNNVFPWQNTTVRTYQQIHGDLPGTVLIGRLSFRINTPTTPTTYTGTRTIDAELAMGNGPSSHAAASRNMPANFTGPVNTVMARRLLNWGPYGTTVSPGPQPFTTTMDVPLDTPYLWAPAPTPTLTWQAKIYSNPASGSNPLMDADSSSMTTAATTVTGAGCLCTGRTVNQTLSVSAADVQGLFALAVGVGNGPSSSPVYLAIGTNNPNLPFPGLCSNLLTDLQVFVPLGTTSTTGALANSASEIGFAVPNTFSGASFQLQAHAVDTGQAGLPICNSEGRTFTVPAPNTAQVLLVTRMFDSSGTTTATTSLFFTGSSIGYGLVTQFQ